MPYPLVTFLNKDRWRLEKAFSAGSVEVPAGFEFDLASIPRPLWWLIAPFELSLAAPLVHDYLYRHGGVLPDGRRFTRADADRLFLEIMRAERVPYWRRVLAFPAVRLFGWTGWKEGGEEERKAA